MERTYFCGKPSIHSAFFTYGLKDFKPKLPFKLLPLPIATSREAHGILASLNPCPKVHHGETLQLLLDVAPSEISPQFFSLGLSTEHCENKKPASLGFQTSVSSVKYEKGSTNCESAQGVSHKEIQRRLKIGAANRGRIPWNKGKKHSEETRERIKKKTLEALSNPKVRKKMSQFHHRHSDQSKSRISSSLKKIWEERRKIKRLQAQCYTLWARTIAEAAKIGTDDQEELEWDDFEKMKADFMTQQVKLKEEKERAKVRVKLRAEMVARERAEKIAKLAEQRKLRKQMMEDKQLELFSREKSNREKKIPLSKSLKLRARLTKFRERKKQLSNSWKFEADMIEEPRPEFKKWDMEVIKNESLKQISLADQIEAVKNRTELSGIEIVANASID
ncbi:uncharacterized protein LOC121984124 [Zingiber officinale]|uniref:Nuclease associated modular domain-containing protein n=1 Tax=Zingiber officinale TaxID=94328 RepID=A0A8J5G9E3_ZINOF|nr:uncharacterized protein LOC121984124 [Zingiber officinale]XP_042392855.1 uncharacterized protein LOC121984124 [Zingiber officinale]XP_042392856.1 uncharacterized protein LOC121984124 [Zingiber officinale]XP_042392857.1 uncharacterized protein LOC121984124 [Zingiber officinale]XP_042392858.1 uncharacterized protein LOC121984124 [Zingiber officinale]KAG6502836.1 hypothetical protein ZIOFF_035125 [Zingiber officinale]